MSTALSRPKPAALDPTVFYVNGWPILYEDDMEVDLGETNWHVDTDEILHTGLEAHFANRPSYRVFSNMNLYYQPHDSQEISPLPYVSPDDMVVVPTRKLGKRVSSYYVGKDGPAPLMTAEALSERSARQRDLDAKADLYADLGVAEYVLIDVTGRFLKARLVLLRLQPDRSWKEEQDPDGGITSRLGFRLIVEDDGRLRVLDATTGRPYLRPSEAEAVAAKLDQAEQSQKAAEELQRAAEQSQKAAEQALERERRAKEKYKERVRELEERLARARQPKKNGNGKPKRK